MLICSDPPIGKDAGGEDAAATLLTDAIRRHEWDSRIEPLWINAYSTGGFESVEYCADLQSGFRVVGHRSRSPEWVDELVGLTLAG